jgi:hypothetical protein
MNPQPARTLQTSKPLGIMLDTVLHTELTHCTEQKGVQGADFLYLFVYAPRYVLSCIERYANLGSNWSGWNVEER